MLTQCPNCETTFRVTAEILRVADGQVRCGRCQAQFDALERLLEEGDATTAESGSYLHTPLGTADEIEVEEPESMEEITLEGKHIEVSGTYRVLDGAAGESHIRQEVREEWVEIADDDEDRGTEDGIVVEESPADENFAPEEQPQPIRATRAPLGARLHQAAPEEIDDESPFVATPRSESGARLWAWSVIPLALLLGFQVVHHHRSELARHPRLGAPLMDLYDMLGSSLTPDWNLHAYGVKQWGVVMDPAAPGTLKVRASITNGAKFPQPYPLLKLVLEDRWGDQVRARAFEPEEYLDPGLAADRLLAPAQQTNATISIVDPGPDAEGFRFDVCLRGKSGPVCAADVPR